MNKKWYLLAALLAFFFIFTAAIADDDDYDDEGNAHAGGPKPYHINQSADIISAIKYQYAKPKIVEKFVIPTLQDPNTDHFQAEDSDSIYTLPQSNNLDDFNQFVTDLLKEESLKFKNQVDDHQPIQKGAPKPSGSNILYVDYDASIIKPSRNHIISIRFSIQGLVAGAPAYHYHRVYNYLLEDGIKLELNDLFKPDAPYLEVLSSYSNTVLSRRLSDKQLIMSGTEPKSDNFANWNIKPNGLLITFDEGQVAPTINGAQTVLVPYSALKGMTSSDSPIAACVKNRRKCLRNNFLSGGFIDEARTKQIKINKIYLGAL